MNYTVVAWNSLSFSENILQTLKKWVSNKFCKWIINLIIFSFHQNYMKIILLIDSYSRTLLSVMKIPMYFKKISKILERLLYQQLYTCKLMRGSVPSSSFAHPGLCNRCREHTGNIHLIPCCRNCYKILDNYCLAQTQTQGNEFFYTFSSKK